MFNLITYTCFMVVYVCYVLIVFQLLVACLTLGLGDQVLKLFVSKWFVNFQSYTNDSYISSLVLLGTRPLDIGSSEMQIRYHNIGIWVKQETATRISFSLLIFHYKYLLVSCLLLDVAILFSQCISLSVAISYLSIYQLLFYFIFSTRCQQ